MSEENKSDKQVSDKCLFRVRAARTRLIINHGFFGVIANKLLIKENNTWCKTAATDGKHLYYNVEFIMGVSDERKVEINARLEEHILEEGLDNIPSDPNEPSGRTEGSKLRDLIERQTKGLTDNELVFLIVHEILHCAYAHMIRRGGRHAKIWNMAADYAINQIIVRENIGSMPEGGLLDDRYANMAAEEIFKIIQDENQEMEESLDQHMDDGSASDDDSDGDSRGSISDILGGEDEGEGEGEPQLDSDEMQENLEEFQETMKQAAASCDDTPDAVRKMIDKLTKPKIDWRSKLHRTLKSHIKRDMSFSKPNRRGHVLTSLLRSKGMLSRNQTIVLPGLMPEDEIDIAVGLDTSGSISAEMLKDFISEVIGITSQYTMFKMRLFCWDTSVHNVQDFHKGNARDMFTYELQGWGGTTLGCCYEMFKEENYRPKQFVCFTDGHFWGESFTGYESLTSTLFVVHSNDSFTPPFGEWIEYTWENDEK